MPALRGEHTSSYLVGLHVVVVVVEHPRGTKAHLWHQRRHTAAPALDDEACPNAVDAQHVALLERSRTASGEAELTSEGQAAWAHFVQMPHFFMPCMLNKIRFVRPVGPRGRGSEWGWGRVGVARTVYSTRTAVRGSRSKAGPWTCDNIIINLVLQVPRLIKTIDIAHSEHETGVSMQ